MNYALTDAWYGIVAFVGMWIIVTASAHIFCKHARTPRVFGVPLFPWVPSGSVSTPMPCHCSIVCCPSINIKNAEQQSQLQASDLEGNATANTADDLSYMYACLSAPCSCAIHRAAHGLENADFFFFAFHCPGDAYLRITLCPWVRCIYVLGMHMPRHTRWRVSQYLLFLTCAGSMILNAFLLCTLDRDSYIRFGIWSAVCLIVYLLYSLHSIEYHHSMEGPPVLPTHK